jgi:hypothetical protein
MTALRDVIARHVSGPSALGPSETGFNRKVIERELARVRRSREVGFWLLVALYILILIGAGIVVVVNRNQPELIQKLSVATGVSLMGVMLALVSLWSQKSRTDLVMAIVSGMSEDGAKAALNVLLPRL